MDSASEIYFLFSNLRWQVHVFYSNYPVENLRGGGQMVSAPGKSDDDSSSDSELHDLALFGDRWMNVKAPIRDMNSRSMMNLNPILIELSDDEQAIESLSVQLPIMKRITLLTSSWNLWVAWIMFLLAIWLGTISDLWAQMVGIRLTSQISISIRSRRTPQ